MSIKFSLIIPVYNRPEEIRELFQSLSNQTFKDPYEIVLVEDGSQDTSADVAKEFQNKLAITYLEKENSGPGDSRNFGMSKANGNYFIIMDSDCILPPGYLDNIRIALEKEYTDCFGGPDAAHSSFSTKQQAINYAMTSFWTTGGIRGHRRTADTFQPRSFNMGISKDAFLRSGGFGSIHPGEDPDLSIRLKKLGYKIRYFPKAFVYHKRRISFGSFFRQVNKFGKVRPILNKWHPETSRITYWFPTFFLFGLLVSILLLFYTIIWPAALYVLYFLLIIIDSWRITGNLAVAILSARAVATQFTGYGMGFLKSIILVNFSKRKPRQLFPELFYEPL